MEHGWNRLIKKGEEFLRLVVQWNVSVVDEKNTSQTKKINIRPLTNIVMHVYRKDILQ